MFIYNELLIFSALVGIYIYVLGYFKVYLFFNERNNVLLKIIMECL